MKSEDKKWVDVVKKSYDMEMIEIPDVTTEWKKFEKVYFKKKKNNRLFFWFLLFAGLVSAGSVVIVIYGIIRESGNGSVQLHRNVLSKGKADFRKAELHSNESVSDAVISKSATAATGIYGNGVLRTENVGQAGILTQEEYSVSEIQETDFVSPERRITEISEKISESKNTVQYKGIFDENRIAEATEVNKKSVKFNDTSDEESDGNEIQKWRAAFFANNQLFLRHIPKPLNPELGLQLQRNLDSNWQLRSGVGLGMLSAGICEYSDVFDYPPDTTNGLIIADSTVGVLQRSVYAVIPIVLEYRLTPVLSFSAGADFVFPFNNRFEYELHRFVRNENVPNGNDTLPKTFRGYQSFNNLVPSIRINYELVYSSGKLNYSIGLRHMLVNGYRKLPLPGDVRSNPGISIVAGLSYRF